MYELKSKNILITNFSIEDYAGSEINCLEISKQLINMGFNVEVATINKGYPIIEEFNKLNIQVKNVIKEELSLFKYDIIWAHHTIVLDYLIFQKNITADNIIYSSLSSFEPLEHPPLYVNDLSVCLCNSKETKEQLISEGVNRDIVKVFPNYASKEFLEFNKRRHNENLKNICIISNHIPNEVLELKSIFESENINVDIYGINYKTKLITPKLISEYDLVITIGKTIQYAMATMTPVYCYDIHGGPGWINDENINLAYENNFSGRGFSKFTSYEMYMDIVDNYLENLGNLEQLKQFINKMCNLEENILNIFEEKLNSKMSFVSVKNIIRDYKICKRTNMAIIREYEYKKYREEELKVLNRELKDKNKLIETLNEELENKNKLINEELENKNKVIRCLDVELENKNKVIEDLNEELENKNKFLDSINLEIIKQKGIIDQKEANSKYLLELNNEINTQLNNIYSTKTWKIYNKYNAIKFKATKAIKNPKIILDKMSLTTNKVNHKNIDNTILVSVVIPIYDRTNVLIESIESILNQTYENIELILVCDGSPKETIDIVNRYRSNKKVRIFNYKDNSGNAVRGRNKAILEARGKYLAFQDSDDIADKDRIKNSIEHMENYNVDIVYGGWRAIVDGSRSIDIKDGQEVFSPDCDYKMLKEICVPCQSTVMCKVDALRSVGCLNTEMRYREDHELWLRLAYHGYKFKSIDKILTNLRLHSNNLELSFKDTDNHWYDKMIEEHTKIPKLKPKIAYLIPGCGISGGIAVICQHVNRLQKRGYDVLLITEDDNNSIEWFPNQQARIVKINELDEELDVLVATGWSTAYSVDKLNAKRKLYFVQSDETRFYPKDSSEYFKALETYKMNYEFMTEAKWIQKWLKEEFNKESHYVPNGLDENIIYKTEPLVERNEKVRVLLEGPIDIPFKGMEDAFNAVQDLDCEVWCISSAGRPKPQWKCDKFFEKVPMEQMKYIYSSCDIFIKMSRVEGFFGPPLEMMACEGACVVGKVTGYDEYIKNNYNAIVVEQGDIDGAREALKLLINDSNLRKKISRNGKNTANEWKWEPTIDTLEHIMNY